MAVKWGDAKSFVLAAAEAETDECILWPFAKSARTGYGFVMWEGKSTNPARVVLLVTDGLPDEEKRWEAGHAPQTCHNRLCINPRHLRWVTSEENHADRALDGTVVRGEDQHLAKLTEQKVRRIKSRWGTGREMAKYYGVTETTISDILCGRSWSWVV